MIISFLRHRRPGRRCAALAAGSALALLLLAVPAPAWAQEEEEDFSFRQDEELYQLDEAVTMIASSLNRIADRVSILAINSLQFGKDFDRDFRHKARVIFLAQLFDANPAIKLVQCQECQRLQTKIVRGVLKLRKGIPSGEERIALAKELGVHGYIDIGVFRDDRQLTVYLQVIEAETGAIILVEELVGRRAPQRDSLVFSFGEMLFPIDGADHNALVFAVREAIQISERFSFGIELAFFIDNNENNPDAVVELDTGAVVAPTIGYDFWQFSSGDSRITAYFGLGKLISPQLNYGNLAKLGILFIVRDQLEVLLGFNWFQETTLDNGEVLEGASYELRFGYRF